MMYQVISLPFRSKKYFNSAKEKQRPRLSIELIMPSVAYRDFVAQNVGYAKHFEAAYRRWFPEGGCANFKLIP